MNPWVAAGATAVVVSERGRRLLRRGAVAGVAGVMNLGGTFASATAGIAQGAERVASSAGDFAGDVVQEARRARDGSEKRASPAHGARKVRKNAGRTGA